MPRVDREMRANCRKMSSLFCEMGKIVGFKGFFLSNAPSWLPKIMVASMSESTKNECQCVCKGKDEYACVCAMNKMIIIFLASSELYTESYCRILTCNKRARNASKISLEDGCRIDSKFVCTFSVAKEESMMHMYKRKSLS